MNYFDIFNPGYDFDNVMIEFILSDQQMNYGMQNVPREYLEKVFNLQLNKTVDTIIINTEVFPERVLVIKLSKMNKSTDPTSKIGGWMKSVHTITITMDLNVSLR